MSAFLHPEKFSDNEILEKIDNLTQKLQYMAAHGGYGTDTYNQMLHWLEELKQVQYERFEQAKELKPGTVAIIGEDNGEEETEEE